MTEAYDQLVEDMRRLDGMFVDILTDDERKKFDRAIASGIARRLYDGPAGLMGVATVYLVVRRDAPPHT
jgi:hypothetical protein